MSDELSNQSNQAMLVCKRILDEYQEHGHDFEWQKTLLPRLCNLGEYICYLIKEMDKEMTAHKQPGGRGKDEASTGHGTYDGAAAASPRTATDATRTGARTASRGATTR